MERRCKLLIQIVPYGFRFPHFVPTITVLSVGHDHRIAQAERVHIGKSMTANRELDFRGGLLIRLCHLRLGDLC